MTKEDNDKDLMIFALQQRIGELVTAYEFKIATLRVEFTNLESSKEELVSISEELVKRLSKYEKDFNVDTANKLPSVDSILEEEASV